MKILRKMVCFFFGHKLIVNAAGSPFVSGIEKLLACSKCARCGKVGGE
jgi:hypothetical protein